jgi:hypothetical protein
MKKYFISVLLIITILTLGISCRGGRHRAENSGQEISQAKNENSQELQRPLGKQRGQQKRQAVGQGFASRGQNRNTGRAWGPDDVVELTKDEEKAIEIETVRAVYPVEVSTPGPGESSRSPPEKSHCQLCILS